MDSLADHVSYLLQHAHENPNKHSSAVSYQSTFKDEGTRKTEFIVDELERCERDGLLKIAQCVAVSVGGADGSDLHALLTHTAIKTAFLIEYSDDGAEKAREKGEAWKKKGKSLKVLQGDATMRKGDVIAALEKLPNDYTTLVLIFLGVLHELPRRSTPNYDLRAYIGTFSDVLPNNSIFISEPCAPLNWPERVEMKIADLDSNLLWRWSSYIKKSLWDNVAHPDPMEVGNGYVRMTRELAAETLFKTIRRHDLSRHLYEMGERLSSFNPDDAAREIRDMLVDPQITKIVRASNGFMKAYRESDVQVRTDKGPLYPPESHIKLIAHSFKQQAGSSKTQPPGGGASTGDRSVTGGTAPTKGISPPIFKIKSKSVIDLNDQQRILFFREARQLLESGSEAPFVVEFSDTATLEKRRDQLAEKAHKTDKQREEYLGLMDDLKDLRLRSERIHSVIDAFLRDRFRLPLSGFLTDQYYLKIANIFAKGIKLLETGPEKPKDESCVVLVHAGMYKDGPHTTLRLSKKALAAASLKEAGTDLLQSPEDYEGRIHTFPPEVQLEVLYPAVIYAFLRDGFAKTVDGEYQSLDRWQVSRG